MDADAAAYIAAVETADDASLPGYIKSAIDALVVGLKADSNWTPIKASCLLAGPATLDGALVPLRGTAPTPVNFVPDDYDQFTGLKGNGSDKYLNTNRLNSADPIDDCHIAAFLTEPNTVNGRTLFGTGDTGPGGEMHMGRLSFSQYFSRCRSSTRNDTTLNTGAIGLAGISRASDTQYQLRAAGSTVTITAASGAITTARTYLIFARNTQFGIDAFSSTRKAMYSVGSAINMTTLEARIETYMAALAAGPTGSNIRRRQEESMMMASRSGL